MILSRYPLVPVLQCLGSCSILLKCLPGGSESSQVDVWQAAPASLRPDQATPSRKTNQLRQFFTNLLANGLKLKVKDFPTKARKQIFDFLCQKRKISRKEDVAHVRKRQLEALISASAPPIAPHFKKEREARCAENQHSAFHRPHPPEKHEIIPSKTGKSAKNTRTACPWGHIHRRTVTLS